MKDNDKAVRAVLMAIEEPGKPTKDPKWVQAAARAVHTGKMANTLAKALGKRFAYRWQFVDFLGPNGRESAGIVDILAIRKSGRSPGAGLKRLDTFDMQIIQVKGGTAPRPKDAEIARLRQVQKIYGADRVVLFEWRAGEGTLFSVLDDKTTDWHEATPAFLFGRIDRAAVVRKRKA